MMRFIFAELRVSIALVLAATAIPLLWAAHDSARRADLRATRLSACIAHHELADCAMWRQAPVDQTANAICLMRFDPRECQRFMEGR